MRLRKNFRLIAVDCSIAIISFCTKQKPTDKSTKSIDIEYFKNAINGVSWSYSPTPYD